MSLRTPPRVATWLLKRFGPEYQRDSLLGDLFEEYQRGRSRAWYWRQAGAALLPKVAPGLVLRVLIEIAVIFGGIALAESNVPDPHVPTP
jgi:hypothetical protein